MADVVIFDIDDTLANTTMDRATFRESFYATVTKGTLSINRDMLDILIHHRDKGDRVVILTARPIVMHEATRVWVRDNIGDVELIMNTTTIRKDWDAKAHMLTMHGIDNGIAFDDKVENIEMFESKGIMGVLV